MNFTIGAPRPMRAAVIAQRPASTTLHRTFLGTMQLSSASPSLGISNGTEMTVTAMRHGVKKARLGRPADQRKALVRGLVTEVLRHGKITTTKTRAKAIRKYVDRMITLAKDGSLHARRQALAFVYDKDLVASLFEQAPERYAERNGGYSRVTTEIQRRRGDNSEMATIELV